MRSWQPESVAGKRVLLVAPHPDDEAIGCGGSVYLMGQAGAAITVAVLTRGDRGVDGAGTASAATRRAESVAACEVLGTQPPVFLELSSDELRGDPGAAGRRLRQRVGEAAHDVLLLPAPLERHSTHRAALLAGLLVDLGAPGSACWGYGVWDALPAADDVVEVDVTTARSAKTRAIGAHASQNGARALAAAIAARDMAQAVFSRITGDEPRRSVERLLDLSSLASAVAALGRPGSSGRSAPAASRVIGDWIAERSRLWAAALWR